MTLQDILSQKVKDAIKSLYDTSLETVEFQATRKEFEGDITVVVFPMLRVVKGNPVAIGQAIGAYLQEHVAHVTGFNVVKGFLNIVISDGYYLDFFSSTTTWNTFGTLPPGDDAMMVEFASPNTNKHKNQPHLRYLRLYQESTYP